MNNVLLVWENIGEGTQIYLLQNVVDEEFKKLSAKHNKYVGLVEADETEHYSEAEAAWISKYLEDKKDCIIFDSNLELNHAVLSVSLLKIIVTGIML